METYSPKINPASKSDDVHVLSQGLKLTVLTLQHGEEEGAHTGPRAAAVLLSRLPVVRALCAGRRSRGGGAGPRWGGLRVSGLSGETGGGDVQLEGHAFTHAGLQQRAVVPAHFALEPFERAGHLFPEALGVGPVARAGLRFGVVFTLHVGDPAFDARLRVLAFDQQLHRIPGVSRRPRALHLVLEGELPPAGRRALALAPLRSARDRDGLVCSTGLVARTGGHGDLLPEEGQQQPGSKSLQQQHT